ncbi:hypothetical protein FM21_13915 [Streptomyces mutabilis]|uniref:Aldo/keto reductase n=1 Tax=Streptomyces mutabilis TaxID=67332 RepID=A0A086N7I0_9ACTN|nr:hypothetical protein FM21_13915 [Streptomyces mutabilis]
MTSETITAESSGTWHLGDLPARRVGLGAMRLTGSAAFHLGTPSGRERSLAVRRHLPQREVRAPVSRHQ